MSFPTALGWCTITWCRAGVRTVTLPDPGTPVIEDQPARVPAAIRQLAEAITSLLDGAGGDLPHTKLDMSDLPPYCRRVYSAVRRVRRGETASYAQVALMAGMPGAARVVGRAMARNPFAFVVPCHRVVGSGGRIGGYGSVGGIATKIRLLQAEGTPLPPRTHLGMRSIRA